MNIPFSRPPARDYKRLGLIRFRLFQVDQQTSLIVNSISRWTSKIIRIIRSEFFRARRLKILTALAPSKLRRGFGRFDLFRASLFRYLASILLESDQRRFA
jgi:hypothetical protein